MSKILIVDDDPGVLGLLKTYFEKQGDIPILAKNGEDALVLVDQERPAMTLLDVTMPGMSGLEVLKKIREKVPDMVVAMITGVHDEHLANEASALGSYAYVTKPFDLYYLGLVVSTGLMMYGKEEKSKQKL